MSKLRGLFIVFEGIDGSGKSTQARLLVDALDDAYLTREPTEHYESTSTRPDSTALGFALDRRNHQDPIEAFLASGRTVICDRYSLSMQAYQYASGCDLDWLIALDRGCRVPDLTIYLQVCYREAMRRLKDTPGENHELDRLRTVEEAYTDVISRAWKRGERIVKVGGMGTPESVHAAVVAEVRRLDILNYRKEKT